MAGGRSLSTENDSNRGLALAPGLQTHGQRVAHRNSTHSFALDKTFRFIDGMTNRRGSLQGESGCWTEIYVRSNSGRFESPPYVGWYNAPFKSRRAFRVRAGLPWLESWLLRRHILCRCQQEL